MRPLYCQQEYPFTANKTDAHIKYLYPIRKIAIEGTAVYGIHVRYANYSPAIFLKRQQ